MFLNKMELIVLRICFSLRAYNRLFEKFEVDCFIRVFHFSLPASCMRMAVLHVQ